MLCIIIQRDTRRQNNHLPYIDRYIVLSDTSSLSMIVKTAIVLV